MMDYRQWRSTWSNRMHLRRIRIAVWLDAMIYDHGLLRLFWNHPKQFASNAWRSNQPTPSQLFALANKGIKTVVSLRGLTTGGASLLELEACESANLQLVPFKMSSRGAPSQETLLNLFSLFEQIDKPVLFHCKSGADRAGFVAALYLLVTGEGGVQEAKAQLSWRYLHFRGAKTGMLFAFLEAFERFSLAEPCDIKEWVENYYDERLLSQSFQPRGLSVWLVDKVLRRE